MSFPRSQLERCFPGSKSHVSQRIFKNSFYIYLFVCLFICVYVCVDVPHPTCKEIQGQLTDVSSHLPLCGFLGLIRFGSKGPLPTEPSCHSPCDTFAYETLASAAIYIYVCQKSEYGDIQGGLSFEISL